MSRFSHHIHCLENLIHIWKDAPLDMTQTQVEENIQNLKAVLTLTKLREATDGKKT